MAELIHLNSFPLLSGDTIDAPIVGGITEEEIQQDPAELIIEAFRVVFPNAQLPDVDVSGMVALGLSTSVDINAWKGLRLESDAGHFLASISMDAGEHGPAFVFVDAGSLPGARLIFQKEDWFLFWQIHADRYELHELPWAAGRSVLFNWAQDGQAGVHRPVDTEAPDPDPPDRH